MAGDALDADEALVAAEVLEALDGPDAVDDPALAEASPPLDATFVAASLVDVDEEADALVESVTGVAADVETAVVPARTMGLVASALRQAITWVAVRTVCGFVMVLFAASWSRTRKVGVGVL